MLQYLRIRQKPALAVTVQDVSRTPADLARISEGPAQSVALFRAG